MMSLIACGIAPEPVFAYRTEYGVAGSGEAMPVDRMPESLRTVQAYWNERRGDRPAPRFEDVDLLCDLPKIAPRMLLWTKVDDERGYVCRLAGTQVCELAGRELRGISVDEMHWDRPEDVRPEYDTVSQDLQLHYVERRMSWARKAHKGYQRLLLPLSRDGVTADRLLGVLSFR